MKVKLLRNWYNEFARELIPAGTELEVVDTIGPKDPKAGEKMPKAFYDKYVKAEKESGPEYFPYFAGTDETKAWVVAREKRFAAVKAENDRRAAVQARAL